MSKQKGGKMEQQFDFAVAFWNTIDEENSTGVLGNC